ncbi:MAG: DUF4926 domain-containing protein [Opitutaceae bacterium]|jgi:hypothetical protein
MNLKEHEPVVLTRSQPENGLEAGDVGTIVHVHRDGAAFEVEFMTLTGRTVAVITVPASGLRPVSQRDVSHVRQLSAA